VRLVTGGATLGRRSVRDLAFELRPFMATQAELALAVLEDPLEVRTVRIVAFGAGLDLGMEMNRVEPQLLLVVAAIAEIRLALLQTECADQAVRLVTRSAVSFGDRSVDPFDSLSNRCVAVDAVASALEAPSPFQLPLGGQSERQDRTQSDSSNQPE